MVVNPIAIWIPVTIGVFNILVVLFGAAIIWGRMTSHLLAVKETVEELDKVIHPDPNQTGSKLLTMSDCNSCRNHICKSIEGLGERLETVEKGLTQIEERRSASSKIYGRQWVEIENFMREIKGDIKKLK